MKKAFALSLSSLAALGLALAARPAHAGAYDELSEAQKASLQKGEQVMITEDLPGLPWPRVSLYQRIEATPEEAMAVLADYELAQSYVPNVRSSRISSRLDAVTTDVDYVIHVSLLLEENVTLRCKLSMLGPDKSARSYRQDITLIHGELTRSSESLIRTEPLGTATLLAYRTLVVPDSVLGGLAKDKAVAQVKATVGAMTRQIESERVAQGELLDRQLLALRSALGD
jgi:hypothetical protein